MDAGQFDMFHDRRDEDVRSIGDGVGLHLDGIFQKLVDQDGSLGGDVDGGREVAFQHLLVMDHLHAAPSQDVRWSDHQGVADFLSDIEGLSQGARHSRFRLRYPQFLHYLPETIAIFRQVDHLR